MRYYEKINNIFPEFEMLNKYTLDRNMTATSRTIFSNGFNFTPKQELISLKYDAITFNLYASITMYNMMNQTNIEELKLIFQQSSNNFLQVSSDLCYQLLRIIELNDNKAIILLTDMKKRMNFEKELNLKTYTPQKCTENYYSLLQNFYKNINKFLRTENNYIKHSGNVSVGENPKVTEVFKFDIQDLLKLLSSQNENADGSYLLNNAKEVIEAPIYNERDNSLDKIIKRLPVAINELLTILDKIMINEISDSYKEVLRLTKVLHEIPPTDELEELFKDLPKP